MLMQRGQNSKHWRYPMASLLSAYGMGLADIRASRTEAVEAALDRDSRLAAAARIDHLSADVLGEVEAQGVCENNIEINAQLHLKVVGTDTALPVRFGTLDDMLADFATAHKARFGFDMPDTGLIIHAVDVEAVGQATDLNEPEIPRSKGDESYQDALSDRFFANGAWHQARYVRREELSPGRTLTGPAVLLEEHTSIETRR